jgi:hypothetical protein
MCHPAVMTVLDYYLHHLLLLPWLSPKQASDVSHEQQQALQSLAPCQSHHLLLLLQLLLLHPVLLLLPLHVAFDASIGSAAGYPACQKICPAAAAAAAARLTPNC